jgi:phosphomannomutase
VRKLRIGSAGMRGFIGSGLSPLLAIDFASAFGTFCNGGKIIVASDTRFSSEMLVHTVTSALLACGCEAINAGIMSAPTAEFAVTALGADGGLLIGGGHQSAGWNAIIPLGPDGAYLNPTLFQEFLDIYHSHRYLSCQWDKLGNESMIDNNITEKYLDHICSLVDTAAIRAKKFTVVADFCNGSGIFGADEFAQRLGLHLIPINNIHSGALPHEPEPRPRSAFQVRALMEPLKADVGFVFNTDMSRLSMVTDTGETLSEEYSMPLIATHVLNKNKDVTIVTNSCTTRSLDDVVNAAGAKLSKTVVGQAEAINAMREENAVLCGDGSGSIALSGGVNGYDAWLGAALFLEAMAGGTSSSELALALPRYHIVKRKIPCSSIHAYSLIRNLRGTFAGAKETYIDGLRCDWPGGWLSLRASSTEPVIRMITEWKNHDKAEDMALEVTVRLERMIAQ